MITLAITRKGRNQGDTLIEVTIALSILATVISSGYVMATRAYNIGQAARERTQVINQAQAQIEQLKNFRDTHSWATFKGGSTSPVFFNGIDTAMSGDPCGCFHMAGLPAGAPTQYVPEAGSQPVIGNSGSFSFKRVAVAPDPDVADLIVNYDFALRGGNQATNSIRIKLVNLEGLLQ